MGSLRQDARRRQKRCGELVPGALEHNASDGLSPAWWRTVLCVDSERISLCQALDMRYGTTSIASNVHRGMWRVKWEP